MGAFYSVKRCYALPDIIRKGLNFMGFQDRIHHLCGPLFHGRRAGTLPGGVGPFVDELASVLFDLWGVKFDMLTSLLKACHRLPI